jgi:hypothetical protein
MATLDYKRMFEEAKEELETLHAEKSNLEGALSKIEFRIDAATKVYNAVAPMVGQPSIPTLKDAAISTNITGLKAAGISVAVRSVLDASPQKDFTSSMVRDGLGERGWDWEKYSNALSTIQTVLVRLVESGAAKETTTQEGKKAFYSAKRVPVTKASKPPASLR